MNAEEQRIMELAGAQWHHAGSLSDIVHTELGMTSTRYFQRLNQLLDREDVLAHDPVLVNRLRRIRTAHR